MKRAAEMQLTRDIADLEQDDQVSSHPPAGSIGTRANIHKPFPPFVIFILLNFPHSLLCLCIRRTSDLFYKQTKLH